jgi:hypothetical protein
MSVRFAVDEFRLDEGVMGHMHGDALVTLSEAKVKLHEIVRNLPERNILVLRYGKPVAAVLSFDRYTSLLDRIEDLQDRVAVYEARAEGDDMQVDWDKLRAEAGLMGDD